MEEFRMFFKVLLFWNVVECDDDDDFDILIVVGISCNIIFGKENISYLFVSFNLILL